MRLEVVGSGMIGGNNGSTMTGSGAGAGAGAATGTGFGAGFFLVFLGLPIIIAIGPAKQQHSKQSTKSHCQSSK